MGVVRQAVLQVDPDRLKRYLERASSEVDSYLGQRYALPLQLVDPIIKQRALAIAVYLLMTQEVGLNPEGSGQDQVFRDQYLDALKWLQLVVDTKVSPSVIDANGAATGAPATGAAATENDRASIRSSAGRGWSTMDSSSAPDLFQSDRRRRR